MKPEPVVITARIIFASLLLACLANVGVAQRIADSERTNLLASAANAYYNARKLGLREFSCVAKPDCSAIVGSYPANPDGAKLLNAQHYYLKLNSEDDVQLTHKSDFPPAQEYEKALKDLFSGMQEMTTGFFAVWSGFALRNPFPEAGSKCEMLSSASGYEIRCDESSSKVVTFLKKDFSITEIRLRAPGVTTAVMRPVFSKTPEGFLLTGYDSDTDMPDGSKIKGHVDVVYDAQAPYRLPGRIKFDGSVGNQQGKIDLILSEYQITKK